MSRSTVIPQVKIYQIKITIVGISPPIWRRLQLPADSFLDELHWIIQRVMGRTNTHPHQFIVGGRGGARYAPPALKLGPFSTSVGNSERTSLGRIADKVGAKLIYEYDFGDSWKHEIRVEKILEMDPGARYPGCLAGKRACPPEDIGGIGGYYHLLEALESPDTEEAREIIEIYGDDDYDPEAFDPEQFNQR
jgi:hypothetical protein